MRALSMALCNPTNSPSLVFESSVSQVLVVNFCAPSIWTWQAPAAYYGKNPITHPAMTQEALAKSSSGLVRTYAPNGSTPQRTIE
eukprot:3094179-Amphidinium_carterae.1